MRPKVNTSHTIIPYTLPLPLPRPPDASESSLPVDWFWQRFVADNLLLYSGILAAVLPRLLRLDLSAPKNAHMLYRITKVGGDYVA